MLSGTVDGLSEPAVSFDESVRDEWIRVRQPYLAQLELTPRCNFDCVHCYLQDRHSEDNLPFAHILKIIDIIHDAGVLFLTLTGGEVLTRPDFLDIYRYAKRSGFLVEVFTNASLVSTECIRTFKELPPTRVDVSLYGACEDTYRQVTGRTGMFERVIGNVRAMMDSGIHVFLRTPVLTLTQPEIEPMRKLARNLGCQFVATFEMIPTIDGGERPLNYRVPVDDALAYEFEDSLRRERESGGEERDVRLAGTVRGNRLFACNIGRNTLVVDYRGYAFPCMKMRREGVSLLDTGFKEIWKSFAAYGDMVASSDYPCSRCAAQRYCDICPADAMALLGNYELRSEDMCAPAFKRKAFYEGRA